MKLKSLAAKMLLSVVGLLCAALPVWAIGTNQFDSAHPMADRNKNKIFDSLETELQVDKGQYPVIVLLNERVTPELLTTLKAGIGEFTPTYTYTYLQAFATKLTAKQITRLKDYSQVAKIQWDAPLEVYMNSAADNYGITQARRTMWLDGDRDGNPGIYTLRDVVIAFIDTGIDTNHIDLPVAKVLGWRDFLANKPTPYDDHGHGTHVAGIASGTGRGDQRCTGVAPGSAVVMAKALDNTGKGRMSVVDAALEWIITEKDKLSIDVLNLSFGTRGPADGSDSTCQLINYAQKSGIVVVAAAGNLGPGKQTIASPGAAEKAITVGGMADRGEGGDFLAYFSSRGPTLDGRLKPDLTAPCWRIMAPQFKTKNQYTVYSGTSMAVPFVAGIAALLLDFKPALTPDQLKDTLLKGAEDWGPKGWDADYGTGKLHLEEAINRLKTPPGKSLKNLQHFRGEEELPATGFYDRWIIDLQNTKLPLAITMVTELVGKEDNFNLYLYDPRGNQIMRAEQGGRQEWLSYQPIVVGQYVLEVLSDKGKGKYYLDFSGDIGAVYLQKDNCN